MNVYIGPIQHDRGLCKPDRCPGDAGCWCAACERDDHPTHQQWDTEEYQDWQRRELERLKKAAG